MQRAERRESRNACNAAVAAEQGGDRVAAGADDAPDPYGALVHLSERQLALAREGELGELRELSEEWQRLTAHLPAQPPESARGALECASALHAETHLTLLALREATLGGLHVAARARSAAQGYAQSGSTAIRRVDRNA